VPEWIEPVTSSRGAGAPTNPIDAVAHVDPNIYYTTLTGNPPTFDTELEMWIVAAAPEAAAVLSHPSARVRPIGQPCPPHLGNGAAAATFQRIARMNDGNDHAAIRQMIDAWFAALTPDQVNDACDAAIADVPDAPDHRSMIEQWMRVYPCAVMVRLMTIDTDHIPDLVAAAEALAAAFGPGAGSDAAGPADAAIATIADALDELRKPTTNSAAGFLFQTFDATAALIGNALLHLAEHRDTDAVSRAIQHSLRRDLPIHNTRRFAHADLTIGDTQIDRGDTILVVLAAASLNPATDEQIAFGAGVHRCPASTLAPTICHAAMTAIIERLGGAPVPTPIGYRTRQNARIPQFNSAANST
jgi:cytochrome P450